MTYLKVWCQCWLWIEIVYVLKGVVEQNGKSRTAKSLESEVTVLYLISALCYLSILVWKLSSLNFHFILCTSILRVVILTLTVLNFQPCEEQSQLESLCEGSLKCYHGNFHAYSKLRQWILKYLIKIQLLSGFRNIYNPPDMI